MQFYTVKPLWIRSQDRPGASVFIIGNLRNFAEVKLSREMGLCQGFPGIEVSWLARQCKRSPRNCGVRNPLRVRVCRVSWCRENPSR